MKKSSKSYLHRFTTRMNDRCAALQHHLVGIVTFINL